VGLSLGLFKGATPCLKILLLAPLLLVTDIATAIVLLLVFVLASSVYPIIGFLFSDALQNWSNRGREIELAGATLLVLIGVYYLARALLFEGCIHG